jgi:Raf kinase inhibitor-like YbhB/YbcL family protein
MIIVFLQPSITTMDTTLTIMVRAFDNGQKIPVKYTCDGKNISPEIRWSNVPSGTKSFVLIITDHDAKPATKVQWIVFNIPVKQRKLHQDIKLKKRLKNRALQGMNSSGYIGYSGPCPPSGRSHQYVIKLYALDSMLNLKPGATKTKVLSAMKGDIIEAAILKAKYKYIIVH